MPDDAWGPCKLADAVDFFRPAFVEHIRRVGEHPKFHCKQWEWAQLLEVKKHYAPNAKQLVGLGCGCERTIPLLAEGADEVICTDLYGLRGAWEVAQRRPDEVYPGLANLRVHPMDMRKIDLPEASADFVWSMCAIEHVGGLDDIVDAVRQAGRLLRDDGVMFVSTEFNLGPRRYRNDSTMFLDREQLERVVRGSGLHLVAPIALTLSDHPMNTPVWNKVHARHNNVPHVVYRHQKAPFVGIYATVVSLVLSRRDHGAATFAIDPELDAVVARLGERGRALNRHLAPPWRWW